MEYSKKTIDYIKKNNLDKVVPFENFKTEESLYYAVGKAQNEIFMPEWDDLVFYHSICVKRNVINVLEFGSGYSSLIMADALLQNKKRLYKVVSENIRKENPFVVYSVEDNKDYAELLNKKAKLDNLNVVYSPTYVTSINHKICTLFETLPNVCPDLILLDGPGQFSARGDINGIHTRSVERVPMAADILTFEHFLLPGTIIVVDGRTANVRFLKCNLQRGWSHIYIKDKDMHLLELKEKPLGPFNQKQIEICLGSDWLLDC